MKNLKIMYKVLHYSNKNIFPNSSMKSFPSVMLSLNFENLDASLIWISIVIDLYKDYLLVKPGVGLYLLWRNSRGVNPKVYQCCYFYFASWALFLNTFFIFRMMNSFSYELSNSILFVFKSSTGLNVSPYFCIFFLISLNVLGSPGVISCTSSVALEFFLIFGS